MKRVSLAICGVVFLAARASADNEPARHWAYQSVVRPDVPVAEGGTNPIDAFLLAELSSRGLAFSPPADDAAWLRRLKFDLLGLPPTPDELAAFVRDESASKDEAWVDRFLESPHYGERWGRSWLDVVRYADSAGFNADPVRPLAYQYRDYVIRSFNDDVPFDRFLCEQLAGDELAPERPEAWIATGFLRLGPDESNASNILLARQEQLNELTANVSAIFLAQSLGCAQCHDHKFEPLTQLDYYRLQAFFAGVIPLDGAAVGTPEQIADLQSRQQAWEESVAPLKAELRELERPARIAAAGDKRMKFPEVVLAAIDAPPEERTALQHQFAFFGERQIPITEEQLVKHLSAEDQTRRRELLEKLAEFQRTKPEPSRWLKALAATDGQNIPPTFFLEGGSYDAPSDEVQPGFPEVIAPDNPTPSIDPPRSGTTGRRTALARWLTDRRHPLTARVMVNRIWQGHFGKGLVPNANDFGTQSPPPSHPELLDWLAAEFMEPTLDSGVPWSLKRIHRMILLSRAYRQSAERTSSREPTTAQRIDPDNRLYWTYPSRRLDAEGLRDSILAVSGRLNPKMFGPGVQPELPPGYSKRESWKVTADPDERQRRSVYILAKRNLPYPLLNDFDLPDSHESCARRVQTTTAPQALTLMNSRLVLDEARAFAGRLLRDHPRGEPNDIVPAAYRLAFCREPTDDELQSASRFLANQELAFSEEPLPNELLPVGGFPKFLSPPRGAAIVDFCHVLMNANEFLYLD